MRVIFSQFIMDVRRHDMFQSSENTDLHQIVYSCLNLITRRRTTLERTQSQTKAVSVIWFFESQLKQINTPQQFIEWVQHYFEPKFNEHRHDSNTHIRNTLLELADNITSLVKSLNCFDEENEAVVANMMAPPEGSLSGSATPILERTLPLDYDDDDLEEETPLSLQRCNSKL